MSVIDSVRVLSDAPTIKIAALGATTASSEQAIGINTLFEINATQDITIKVGETGMTAAAATDFRIPANTMRTFDMGRHSFIRVFNLAGSAADIYIRPVSKF